MKNKNWHRLISYYVPYKKVFFADMFFAVINSGVTLVIPLLVRYITNDVIYRDAAEAQHAILIIALVLLGLVALECYSKYFVSFYGHIMGTRMESDMRKEIFAHYQKLSFSFFDNEKVGQLMSRVTNDLNEISELLHHGPEDLVISTIKLVGSFTILFFVNWRLALVAFMIVPLMVAYAVIYNKKMRRAFKKNRARLADINAQIEDNLSGIRVVKSFANEDVEMGKFKTGNDRFVESKRESYYYMALYHSGLGIFTTLLSVAVVIAGALFITRGIIAVTDLITFLLYINNVIDPVRTLINFTEQFQNGASGYERFREILAIHPDIADRADAVDAGVLHGDIHFNNVSFHYEEGTQNVLSHVDLSVKAGEYVALIGTSGVGKSTLCSLIPRFYDVSGGSITIDGTDVRDMTLHSLRLNIGIVQQDVYLFAGSVMDNIRYGRPDASDAEIIAAARNANAHDFIMELPDGYDTYIGQRGIKLSGGQKQRLSIARVFLKDPPILIFDEATSSLDNESEKIVQDSLERLAVDRTTFVIAHRLSTIRNARRILVLTEDGIVEEGCHAELLERNGVYAHLYRMQFAEE